jgi:hypothetical protein
MFFSSEYWPFALLWAIIAGVVSAAVAYAGNRDSIGSDWDRNKRTVSGSARAILAGGVTFVVALFAVRFVMYYVQPSFQGSFFGYWEVLFASMVPAFAVGLIVGGGSKTAWTATALAALTLFGVPTVQYGYNAWGPANAVRFADLPNIRIAGPDETIPPTDPNRMVLVTRSIAVFKGQTALATEAGIASRYGIDPDTYTLQFVNGHRYWIAPLSPINNGDTFWTPLFGGTATSPGYVVVDAENPAKDAWLKTGYEISLFTNQSWSMNLLRAVYLQGYRDGLLEEPLFEVDDEWRPFYTISYVKRAFGGITGRKLDHVIAVDVSKSTPAIQEYTLADKPKWIDRVVADDLVQEWASDWGVYGGEFARKNFWSVFFGINKTGTMEPADLELNYTKDEHNVWVVPMTSTSANDHTVIGVLVFETGENKGTFYPGIKGFNEPSSVDETMVNARDNIKHYPVESVQLYNIYGELTWVAIYASPQSIGKSFGGIGMVHAHSQDAADVIYANDRPTALRLYATQLARSGNGSESISQTARQSKEITGRVKRIAVLPSSQLGGAPTYMFIIEGDAHTFLVTRDTYLRVPLVREGDEVTFTYLDTDSAETAVTSFSCRALDGKTVTPPALQPEPQPSTPPDKKSEVEKASY